MAKTVIFIFRCPKCNFPARAEVEKFSKFLIYVCPKCHSNVVYYGRKIDILSDDLVRSLKKKKKLKFCGNALFPAVLTKKSKSNKKKTKGELITQDKLIDLKILLETETDFDEFLSKL